MTKPYKLNEKTVAAINELFAEAIKHNKWVLFQEKLKTSSVNESFIHLLRESEDAQKDFQAFLKSQ